MIKEEGLSFLSVQLETWKRAPIPLIPFPAEMWKSITRPAYDSINSKW